MMNPYIKQIKDYLNIDDNDLNTIGNFCITFGVTGLIVTLVMGTAWYYIMLSAVTSAIAVLFKHYEKEIKSYCVSHREKYQKLGFIKVR